MSDFVLTQDISSGRVHKRFRADKGYATHEADNLDDAGAYRVLTQGEFDELPVDARCRRCFPEVVTEADQGAFPEPEDDASTQDDTP